MLSKYFQLKTQTQKFKDDLNWSLGEIKDKKVLIYGAGEGFEALNKIYKFTDLNIVAISDKKFEVETEFMGLKAINPENIEKEDYDVILITNENAAPILKYLQIELNIQDKEIRTVFNEEIKDERSNFLYLESFNFEKHLKKLNKKLKNKKIIIYGAGAFLEVIKKYYDLSKLNIIAVADKRYSINDDSETFLGYKTCSPEEIIELEPDFVLVATKFFINIIEDLYYYTLKDTKIKIKPLIKKPFMTLLKEIWK